MRRAEKIDTWLKECVEQSGTFFLTTRDGGRLKSRPLRFHALKAGKNYFRVRRSGAVYREMQKDPQVEITGVIGHGSQFFRFFGKAVFTEDPGLRNEVLEQQEAGIARFFRGRKDCYALFALDGAVGERSTSDMAAILETVSF